MGYYVEWTGSDVSSADAENLRAKLHEAQAEIRRLPKYEPVCAGNVHVKMMEAKQQSRREGEWLERVRSLEKSMERLCRTVARHQDVNIKHHKDTGELRGRVVKLEAPPKDLSDPYPLDGPNVREQNRYDSVAKRLEALERSIVAVGGVSTLEARLTALSETVARNKKHHDVLTELVTDLKRDAGQVERRAEQQRRTSHGRRDTGNASAEYTLWAGAGAATRSGGRHVQTVLPNQVIRRPLKIQRSGLGKFD